MAFKIVTCTSAAALSIFMTGSAAFADISGQQVWDEWKNYMSGFGYQVGSSESTSGNDLMISDLSMSMELPEGEGTLRVALDQITFTDNGDGTVSLMIPPVMPVTINMMPNSGENVDLVVDYATTGHSVVISGDPSDITYSFSMADITVALAKLAIEGVPVDLGSFSLSMSDVTGTSNMKIGNLRTNTQKFDAGPVKFAVDFADPESEGRFVMNGEYSGMGFEGGGSFPLEMDTNDFAKMLAAGFSFGGDFTIDSGTSSFNIEEDGEIVQGTSSSDGGFLEVAMDETQIHYAGESTNLNVQFAGGEIPFPVELAMAKYGFNLQMPISKSDAEQDFALAINLGDFSMSDMIWSIFDPDANLPRDPATIAMDFSGKAKLFFDLMDPKQMEAVESGEAGMPGELNSLNLNSLIVSAAGAKLTGDGAFTFDNADLSTFDGIPAPTGAIDLQLVGGNGLLDKLIAMGLLPEDQAMGMRMMMGLFAVPGDGEDTLTSKIEVTGDGQIKANGQRLK